MPLGFWFVARDVGALECDSEVPLGSVRMLLLAKEGKRNKKLEKA